MSQSSPRQLKYRNIVTLHGIIRYNPQYVDVYGMLKMKLATALANCVSHEECPLGKLFLPSIICSASPVHWRWKVDGCPLGGFPSGKHLWYAQYTNPSHN